MFLFGVETEEDLFKIKDKLSAAGLSVSDVIDHGFIHSVYAFDPNGIPIEFSNNVKGVDMRKNPSMRAHPDLKKLLEKLILPLC